MKNKDLLFSLLLVAMTLGTAWAIRGQFGHEHGAAEHSQQQPGKDLTLLCDTFKKTSH